MLPRRIEPGENKEIVVVMFLPCEGTLDDCSKVRIGLDYVVKLKVGVVDITVAKFIEELGKTVAWGRGQEVELCYYGPKKRYERILTTQQLVKAIEGGRREDASKPVAAIYAELIEAGEDFVVGFVASKAAEALNDVAFRTRSVPVQNIADFGPNQIPTPADLSAPDEGGGGTFVDWSKVDLEEPTDFDDIVIEEDDMFELYGILVDKDKDGKPTKKQPPTSIPVTPPTAADNAESDRLASEAAIPVDDDFPGELRCVYDRDCPVFEVGRMFPTMNELKMCFKTYAVQHEFQTKTAWTSKERYCVRCKGFDGNMLPCPWYMSCRKLPDGLLLGSIE